MSFSRHLFNVILQRKGRQLLPNGIHCKLYPLLPWQFLRTNASSLDSMESDKKMDQVVQSEAYKVTIEISSTPFDTFVMNNELKKLGMILITITYKGYSIIYNVQGSPHYKLKVWCLFYYNLVLNKQISQAELLLKIW